MFEAAELGHAVSKLDFDNAEVDLRTQLLEAQFRLAKTDKSMIILISGVQGAGKGGLVNRLNEWMDSRYTQTHSYWETSEEETERPRYWKYWRTLPARGKISILFDGWYRGEIFDNAYDSGDLESVDAELAKIVDFERMLAVDGAIILKFWYHLPRKVQRERLQDLSADQRSYWKMARQYAGKKKEFSKFTALGERIIRSTDTGLSPWHVIESTNARYRDLTTARIVLKTLQQRLDAAVSVCAEAETTEPPTASGEVTVLDKVDLSKNLEKTDYKQRLGQAQKEINRLTWEAYRTGRATVLVFEGWDAGGKGGAIRRLTSAVDSRIQRAIAIAAPTEEERGFHYLWRFWRHIPRAGHLVVFDRSWYGRVLVERIEGFASTWEWQRAYREINGFEQQLAERGIVIEKFWLHIDQDEQLRRFKEREKVPYKKHKITDEDWRNREKWDAYEMAVNEMVIRTSTDYAPWTLVAGNDKRYARVQVLERVCRRLRAALGEA